MKREADPLGARPPSSRRLRSGSPHHTSGSAHGPRPTAHAFLLCGVLGLSLDTEERQLLGELQPGGIILFARNVASREQLVELVGDLRALPSRPYVSIDMEGGRVNRLEGLLGPLPSAAATAAAGLDAVAALGAAIGAACAHFGIGVDLAPVVDVASTGGWLAGESRCFAGDVAGVVAAAEAFLGGIERFGVAGCLKHYPGLGTGAVDSHRDLPLLDDGVAAESRAFSLLARPHRAVMVAHALAPALGDGARPTSLSATVLAGLRPLLPVGPVIADDLEMGALAAFGSLAERAAAALLAGCDQVPVCNDMAARAPVAEAVARWARTDSILAARLDEGAMRCAGFGDGALADVAWSEVESLAERARRQAGISA